MNPTFGVAMTLTFIVILDARGLRRQVGKHAAAINILALTSAGGRALRERMGHTGIEIAAGMLAGIAVAAAIAALSA